MAELARHPLAARLPGLPNLGRGSAIWGALALLALAIWLLRDTLPWLSSYPARWVSPLQAWLELAAEAVTHTLKPAARLLADLLGHPMAGAKALLTQIHWAAIAGILLTLATLCGGARMALGTVVAVAFILASGYWVQSMNTLALVLVSVPLALALGLCLGIAAHRVARVRRAVEATLDFMQTVPTFAYLVPLLVLFGFGPVVGLIASAIYAAPPMARNTLLGLQLVHPEIREAAHMAGANGLQRLLLVELPAAGSQIMVGVNQSIMAALSMVIIAAVIGGFEDIGWEVLLTMRKAQFGESLLAGSVIVVFAILLDRLSARLVAGTHAHRRPVRLAAGALLALSLGLALTHGAGLPDSTGVAALRDAAVQLSALLDGFVAASGERLTAIKNTTLYVVMLPIKIGLDDAVLDFTWGFAWTRTHSLAWLGVAALAAGALLARGHRGAGIAVAAIAYVLLIGITHVPWPLVVAAAAAIGWLAGGWRLALFAAVSFLLILLAGLWDKAMMSVYLCATATLLCLVFGAAIGLLSAQVPAVWAVVRPVCDTLQTIPLFVFLIPVLMLFQIGEFSALLAIMLYAIVPIIRYTQYGLTSTPVPLLEAAATAGCTRWQTLVHVRIPYAVPSLLLGTNQTVLYAFAMLVISALVGTTDLGQDVYVALGRADLGLGLSAGIAMALLAMVVDRVIQALAAARKRALGLD